MGGLFGAKAPTVTPVSNVPPPAPPAQEASLEEFADEELDRKKRKAKVEGASSLQIPLGGTEGSGGTIGTL